jgi:hypothetical protein
MLSLNHIFRSEGIPRLTLAPLRADRGVYFQSVMAGLVPAIHAFVSAMSSSTSALTATPEDWMAGTRPAMTALN